MGVNGKTFKVFTRNMIKAGGRKIVFQKLRIRNLHTINRPLHCLFESACFIFVR